MPSWNKTKAVMPDFTLPTKTRSRTSNSGRSRRLAAVLLVSVVAATGSARTPNAAAQDFANKAPAGDAAAPYSLDAPLSRTGPISQTGPQVSPRASLGIMPTNGQIDAQRERLFNELAEEFAQFDRLGNLVRQVSQLVKPSVIHIEAHKVSGRGASAESYDEAGSGVVIEIGGDLWVLTNRHVIHGAGLDQIVMRTSDGRRWAPERILMDSSTDVAVMKIAGPGSTSRNLGRRPANVTASNVAADRLPPPARLADSNRVQIGDFVIAIGSPFGLSHSVTFGIMSAKGRRDLTLGEERIDLQDFFQTDAAINPGNSGGPLLNLRGEVIGLNTAIASSSGGSEGIGFAIPINMAARVAEELVLHGKLRRGYLGVTLDPEFAADEISSGSGLYASMKRSPDAGAYPIEEVKFGGARVKNVRAGSPAESARLQNDDIILQFDGILIEDDDHLVARVGMAPTDQPIEMVILRDGQRYRTEVTLQQMP